MVRRCLNTVCVLLLIFSIGIYPLATAAPAAAAEKAKVPVGEGGVDQEDASTASQNETAQDVGAKYQAEAITEKGKNPAPQTTKSSSGGKTLLYAGAGVAAAAAVALAVGAGGSSSSSDEVAVPEEPKQNPVGADLDGDNWHGRLILANSGFKEDVTATVRQNGRSLEITTSTAQKYGKKFIGSINRDAYIEVTDQDTGQDWTSHFQNARWNMIDIYDFVNNFKDLDRLYLTRESK